MNTYTTKTLENTNQSITNGKSQMQNGGESTFQFVDERPEAVAQKKLQGLTDNSLQISRLKSFQEMANDSPKSKQIAQLQAIADNRNTQVVQRVPVNAFRSALKIAGPMIKKGLTLGSGALTIAGSASTISGIYEKGKKKNPENPFDNDTMVDISREAITTAFGFASGPFGKLGTALSFANNLYDANQARVEAQGEGKSALTPKTLEAIAKSQVDGARLVTDYGIFAKVIDGGLGIKKIINDKAALETRLIEVHKFIMKPSVENPISPELLTPP